MVDYEPTTSNIEIHTSNFLNSMLFLNMLI